VEDGATYQEGSAGGEIAIPASIHMHLDEDLQKLFTWNADRELYITVKLTQDKVDEAGDLGTRFMLRPTPVR